MTDDCEFPEEDYQSSSSTIKHLTKKYQCLRFCCERTLQPAPRASLVRGGSEKWSSEGSIYSVLSALILRIPSPVIFRLVTSMIFRFHASVIF